MILSEADRQTFITAYERDFGEMISLVEAREMATRLLAFFELLATGPG
jgi:hypothetical protein